MLFLDQHKTRISQVNELSAVIGLGGLPKPQTREQQRAFGSRIIAVTSARLNKLDTFQASVADWLAGLGLALKSFASSTFYSDSHNDLPLLERVTKPVVVDPDPQLEAEAARRGWQVMSLRPHVAVPSS